MGDDVRKYLNIMRNKNVSVVNINEDNKKVRIDEKSMVRNMIKNMRTLTKEDFSKTTNKATINDQKKEEEKLLSNFKNEEVSFEFQDIEIFDDKIFWGGTVITKSGSLDWVFVVSTNEGENGFFPNSESNFDTTIPENKKVLEMMKVYYDEFYRYWRDNELYDKI